ncbi:IS3 family transposase [Streptomyces antarcticus]|uniref:IS3 family transposase n=1 Tax=Streptomyces antarcticus TaxID=2996458 RepID=UPI0022720104|nr:IS3 family transposase [Streptomyces sp. H34-AA3]MCY0943355.1 IS3 family transposase [Streptomyces sp. H34-AA3]
MRDEELKPLIHQVFKDNYRVYGARKIWRALNRQGHEVARCTIERLIRETGITGAVRGKKVITTIPDPSVARAPDRLDRDFVAPAPNRTWMADFTHVAAWAGTVYVAFVVDTFSRRIIVLVAGGPAARRGSGLGRDHRGDRVVGLLYFARRAVVGQPRRHEAVHARTGKARS